MTMRLSTVRLLVDDVEACRAFYRDLLGFKLAWGEEGSPYVEFETGGGIDGSGHGCNLAIFDRRLMNEAVGAPLDTASPNGGDAVTLTFAVTDVDAACAGLRAKGVETCCAPTDRREWGLRTAHMRDPAGNLIELHSPLPQEATPPR